MIGIPCSLLCVTLSHVIFFNAGQPSVLCKSISLGHIFQPIAQRQKNAGVKRSTFTEGLQVHSLTYRAISRGGRGFRPVYPRRARRAPSCAVSKVLEVLSALSKTRLPPVSRRQLPRHADIVLSMVSHKG